jgi:hypothetical protein
VRTFESLSPRRRAGPVDLRMGDVVQEIIKERLFEHGHSVMPHYRNQFGVPRSLAQAIEAQWLN